MAVWVYKLVNSSNMRVIDTLDYARGRSLNLSWNRPGSASCVIPIDSYGAYNLRKHATALLVERNGEAIWSGPVFTIQDQVPADETTITALGWMEELNHRFIRPDEVAALQFENQVGSTIADALINKCNAQLPYSGGVAYPVRVKTGGSHSDSQVRTRSYQAGQNYGASIRELSDIENGFDIRIDPVTRKVSFLNPATSFIKRTNVFYGYNAPPNNIESLGRTEDGTKTANALSVQTPGGIAQTDSPQNMSSSQVMLEDWISLSDVQDIGIAAAYGNAELVFRVNGNTTLAIKPLDSEDIAASAFDHYQLGDQIYINCDRGRLVLQSQPVRVFSLNVTIDDNGDQHVGELGVVYS